MANNTSLISSNSLIVSKKMATKHDENEIEQKSNLLTSVVSKTNVCIQRLSMSNMDRLSTHDEHVQQITSNKDNTSNLVKYDYCFVLSCLLNISWRCVDVRRMIICRHSIKVPSHVFTRRSPETQKNQRAKTVRIGKIRWPPPINSDEVDTANQQRYVVINDVLR
jgi:SUMO ligase MMS21 Smc5/6 complex component